MLDLKLPVTCPYCKNEIKANLNDYVESEVLEERAMGTETEYIIECDEYICPKCNKYFTISGSIWEYPEGAYNNDTIVVDEIEGQ